ncbi:MAG: NAD(P)-dependent alcohol dehydrogenase [Spirochaetaceae bacterium]|nr:NAD(P)-dependent alcohol dehydrogenase [Spirochaetaceae bacterium]
MKIKAAVVREKNGPFIIEEIDLDGPKAGEVLIKNTASGICHTDLVAQSQELPVPLPLVPGHEGAGIVEAVGAGVKDLAPGDHVVVSYAYCGECPACVAGDTAHCEKMGFLNFGGVMADGTSRLSSGGQKIHTFFGQSSFAEYSVASYRSVVKIDPDIDLAMCAPLGCGIQTGAGAVLNTFRPRFGESIAIFGCGTVGMAAIMAARVAGCREIIAVGGNPASLSLARELGATGTINRKDFGDAMSLGARVRECTHGGAHYVFDTSGNEMMIQAGLTGCRGVFASVGASAMSLTMPFFFLAGKTIVSLVEGDANPRLFIPLLIAYYRQGRFPFDRLNRYYPFAEIGRAVEESHRGDTIKAVITF